MGNALILIVWIIATTIWDLAVWGTASYLVWHGYSGWWFALAFILSYTTTLYDALRKRFGLSEVK